MKVKIINNQGKESRGVCFNDGEVLEIIKHDISSSYVVLSEKYDIKNPYLCTESIHACLGEIGNHYQYEVVEVEVVMEEQTEAQKLFDAMSVIKDVCKLRGLHCAGCPLCTFGCFLNGDSIPERWDLNFLNPPIKPIKSESEIKLEKLISNKEEYDKSFSEQVELLRKEIQEK